ncbi:HAD family hydrolase [Agromyces sp. MMS24-JH15]|uniref:HAD family hydrolase n=1 Tax=Agromyces sp. MMS24-JH15 TaxID=3243765 RepID=UPI00374A401D
MTTRLPAAVLWDMDGTLVDTEPYWMAAEVELLAEFGRSWTTQDAVGLVGSGLWDSAAVLQRAGADLDADAIVIRLTDRVREQIALHGVPWRPGAQELLESLRTASVPTALVTMSIRSLAEDVVGAIPFVAFDVLVTGDDVAESKPHPEPYLRAAELLGVDVRDCVAIEDSPAGVASAAAAGAVAIGVPNIVSLEATEAAILWESLAGRTPADLGAALVLAGDRA